VLGGETKLWDGGECMAESQAHDGEHQGMEGASNGTNYGGRT
jgi:hypothetical protein